MNSYDYYIALDWSQAKMAIALWHKGIAEPAAIEVESDIRRVRNLLKSIKGTKSSLSRNVRYLSGSMLSFVTTLTS